MNILFVAFIAGAAFLNGIVIGYLLGLWQWRRAHARYEAEKRDRTAWGRQANRSKRGGA